MAPVAPQNSQKPRCHGGKRRRTLTDDGSEESLLSKKVVPESPKKRPRADGDIDESIGHMNPSLLADHISKKTKRSFRDLSNVELEDKYLSQQIFYDTSNFGSPRDLDNLPSFVENFSDSNEDLSNTCENPASPHTLVIAASGLRAADLTRSLRRFQSSDCAVAKLFAKHIKLPEAIDYMKRTKIGFGIGTPQRLIDLLEKDSMKTDNLKRIIIDGSHLDQKKRSIFDMKELLDPLIKLFSTKAIKSRTSMEVQPTRVLVF